MINRRKYIMNTYLKNIDEFEYDFFEDKKNKCYISIKKILKLDKPFFTQNGTCLIDKNYYIIEIIPLHENYCIRIFLDDKQNIILYYFDITLSNGFDKKKNSLYYDDLYLDIVVKDKRINVLDEDELEKALVNKEISKEEYELAIIKKDELLDSIKNGYNEYMKINFFIYLK